MGSMFGATDGSTSYTATTNVFTAKMTEQYELITFPTSLTSATLNVSLYFNGMNTTFQTAYGKSYHVPFYHLALNVMTAAGNKCIVNFMTPEDDGPDWVWCGPEYFADGTNSMMTKPSTGTRTNVAYMPVGSRMDMDFYKGAARSGAAIRVVAYEGRESAT
jgi:hypothetical protein